jgi:hypothetical protein
MAMAKKKIQKRNMKRQCVSLGGCPHGSALNVSGYGRYGVNIGMA